MSQQNNSRGFSLTEILIAVVLTSLIILAASSIDISSRRFLDSASKQARIQDEAKIAMEHIVKHLRQGIGDMARPTILAGNVLDINWINTVTNPNYDSRGFFILDNAGRLVSPDASGSRILVKIDKNGDGRFTNAQSPSSADRIIEYRFDAANYSIIFDPNRARPNDEENLVLRFVREASFSLTEDGSGGYIPNQIHVEIKVRYNPNVGPAPENPETTLTSDIILRAMSCK